MTAGPNTHSAPWTTPTLSTSHMSDAVRRDLAKLHPQRRSELMRAAAGKPAPYQGAPRPVVPEASSGKSSSGTTSGGRYQGN
jgi:hypothetical protein